MKRPLRLIRSDIDAPAVVPEQRPATSAGVRSGGPMVEPAVIELPRLTVGQLASTLGGEVLSVACAPAGVNVVISGVLIFDAAETAQFEAGDMLLGVGVSPQSHAALALIESAGGARCAAVALKGRGAVPPQLLGAAQAARVALLIVPPELAWGQLHTLIQTAMTTIAETDEQGLSSLRSGDLFGLANALASTVDGAVTITDAQARVLAYSTLAHPTDEGRMQAILGRRIPPRYVAWSRQSGLAARVRASNDVVEARGLEGMLPRRIIAVRAGPRYLGSITAIIGDKPFGAHEAHAMKEAARIAALDLIRHRTHAGIERKRKDDLIRGVLEGSGRLAEAKVELGVDDGARISVLAFEVQDDDGAEGLLRRSEAADLIDFHITSLFRRAVTVDIPPIVYAVIAQPAKAGHQPVIDLARRVIGQLGERGIRLRAGVSRPGADVSSLPQRRAEADRAMLVSRFGASTATVTAFEDASDRILLRDVLQGIKDRPREATGKLRALAVHDEDHGTSYVATLRAYLDSFGDAHRGADALGIPENTFRYRLKRLLEVSGIRLDEAEERIAIELQLRAIAEEARPFE